MSDDTVASAKIDLRFLLTLAVVFGGVLVGWTVNSEAVKSNRVDVDRLFEQMAGTTATLAQLERRVLSIENAMAYRAETVEQINAKLDRLIEQRPQ